MHGTLYVYLPDALSDWELAYVMPALQMARGMGQYTAFQLKTGANRVNPVRTAGGMTLLPGADSGTHAEHEPVLELADQCLLDGALLATICGAMLALADRGQLDQRLHTSNSPEYLAGLCAGYRGRAFYRPQPAISDGNLITASATGALLFARKVREHFAALPVPMIAAWYDYHLTGDARYFMTFSHLREAWSAERANY